MKSLIKIFSTLIVIVLFGTSCNLFSSQVPGVTTKEFDIHCHNYLNQDTDKADANQLVIGVAPGNIPSGYDWQSFKISIYPIVNGQMGLPVVSSSIPYPYQTTTTQYYRLKDYFTVGTDIINGTGLNSNSANKYKIELRGKWQQYDSTDATDRDVDLSVQYICVQPSQPSGPSSPSMINPTAPSAPINH